MSTQPVVSCLMVTRPSAHRLPLCRRSIECYLRQSYPATELVIALDEGAVEDKRALEAHVAALGCPDVRVVRCPGNPTLGRLRNFAIDQAQGELICVWDDDDIHHPRRLELQVRALLESGGIATFLTEVLHLFAARRELYWTNYRNTV